MTKGVFLSEHLYFIGSNMTSFNTNMNPSSYNYTFNQGVIYSSDTANACYSLK